MTIEFNPKTHTYKIDGERVPSVTDICRFIKREVYKDAPSYLMEEAAKRGTAVHEATEELDKSGTIDVSKSIAGYVKAYATFKGAHKVKWEMTEEIMAHPDKLYCGTLDRYGEIDGELCLVDIKTSSSVQKKLYEAQLNLYAKVLESMGKKIDKLFILHLKKDGKYKLVEMPRDDKLADACLLLHQATAKKPRKRGNG